MTALPSLAPCPFCGSRASIAAVSGTFYACCDNEDCGASPDGHPLREQAIAAWNRRTAPVEPTRPSIARDAKWCQPGDQQSERHFIVRFDDADRGDAIFTDEAEAREYWARATANWNCWLFAAMPIDPPPSLPPSLPSQEDVARVIDPDVWRDDLPIPTRAATEDFHARRQASCATAARILALMGQSGDGWQDIASAPKDGRRVLGYGGGTVEVVFWANGQWFNQSSEINLWGAFPPTHWRPLPAPPAKEGR